MASSGNFTKWTPLFKGTPSSALTVGNTRFDGSTNNATALTDFAIPVGTKFYAEILTVIQNGIYAIFGIAPPTTDLTSYTRTQTNIYGMEFRTQSASNWTVNSVANGTLDPTNPDSGPNVGQTAERVIGIAVNRVDNELKLYLDNTLKFTLSIPSTGEYHFFATHTGATGYTQTHHNFNGGHDSTGGGDFTAASNADDNGFGEFQYSPPSGHLACCSANLPISDDIDPAQTDDDYPSKQFDTVLYTGNASTNNITGLNFQPDLVWIKIRNTASNAVLVDSSRGTNKMIHPNNTDVEVTTANLTSFNSNGFSLDGTSNYQANYNGNGNTYVAWCWRANGGTTASNSNGAISSTVQANQAAGFSIVQWTANATSSVATTVGHGLSKAPEFVITKSRDSSGNWCVTHTGLSSPSHMLFLNTDGAQTDKSGNGNMSANTSTVFSVNATDGSNSPNTDAMIAYVWHSVEGYSKFGSYTGNSNNDGPFIYTGFRPRMVFLKLRDSAGDWWIYDSARDTANPVNKYISWNRTDAEASGLNADFLSNGFKLRNTSGDFNSSATILYGAWGDVPWKYNNTF